MDIYMRIWKMKTYLLDLKKGDILFWKMEFESGYAPNLPKTVHRNDISHKAGKQQLCQALVFIFQINMFVNQET